MTYTEQQGSQDSSGWPVSQLVKLLFPAHVQSFAFQTFLVPQSAPPAHSPRNIIIKALKETLMRLNLKLAWPSDADVF